jgi:hypothetical protein
MAIRLWGVLFIFSGTKREAAILVSVTEASLDGEALPVCCLCGRHDAGHSVHEAYGSCLLPGSPTDGSLPGNARVVKADPCS